MQQEEQGVRSLHPTGDYLQPTVCGITLRSTLQFFQYSVVHTMCIGEVLSLPARAEALQSAGIIIIVLNEKTHCHLSECKNLCVPEIYDCSRLPRLYIHRAIQY